MYCLPHVLVIWLSTAHLCTLSALPSETEYEYPVFFAHLIGLPPKYMLSTACAKLAFCSLVYRMCSLFALPSETEHINMIADQFHMISDGFPKYTESQREPPRGFPRVQDSPRLLGSTKDST
jgi:hypothetical protein